VPALLDMSQIPLPNAVEELDYATLRTAWLTRYAELMGLDVEDLDDNDPAVHVCEVGAYREMLRVQSNNDAVRGTMLASATGAQLDDLGADPLYNTPRLVLDEGDETAVPPVAPTYEDDEDYRERLVLAPAKLSPAGSAGAYKALALAAHDDVVDINVRSPDPCEVIIEVLHDSDDLDILDDVYDALSADTVRPFGDLVTVERADNEESTAAVTVYVPDGPDLATVQAAAQARVNALILPICAKVRSGAVLSRDGDDMTGFLGACMVEGATSWELTSSTGMSNIEAAWWPMTITVTAERRND
jgi:phage-related baseplate assembly protein